MTLTPRVVCNENAGKIHEHAITWGWFGKAMAGAIIATLAMVCVGVLQRERQFSALVEHAVNVDEKLLHLQEVSNATNALIAREIDKAQTVHSSFITKEEYVADQKLILRELDELRWRLNKLAESR